MRFLNVGTCPKGDRHGFIVEGATVFPGEWTGNIDPSAQPPHVQAAIGAGWLVAESEAPTFEKPKAPKPPDGFTGPDKPLAEWSTAELRECAESMGLGLSPRVSRASVIAAIDAAKASADINRIG